MDVISLLTPSSMFHVHTSRCGHAFEGVSDEEIIQAALSLGADKIFFTDHAPFPEDPFGNRMKISQLEEYIGTLCKLKRKYKGLITVFTGLEIEYLPSYDDYYKELKSIPGLDLLVLGQHFFENEDGSMVFSNSETEWCGCSKAVINGCKTGYFDVIAHPTRQFRLIRKKHLLSEQLKIIREIHDVSVDCSVPLEYNLSCMETEFYDRPELWDLIDEFKSDVIVGLDAHDLESLKSRYIIQQNLFQFT